MKILILTPRVPFPPTQGDRRVVHNRIKKLSLNHEVHLITFDSYATNESTIAELKKYCTTIKVIVIPKWQSVFNMLKGVLFNRDTPFQVKYFNSPEAQNIIDQHIDKYSIDIIHANYFRVAQYVMKYNDITLMDLFDSMTKNISTRIKSETLIKRIFYGIELKRVKSYENKVFDHFKHNLLISSIDQQFFRSNKICDIVPLGIEMLEFLDEHDEIEKGDFYDIIFIGNMSYTPNIEGISWLIDNCWKELSMKIENIRLWVVGTSPASRLVDRYKNIGNIIFTDYVKSLKPYLKISDVSIAPMFSGSGMQHKILESMFFSVPVVTTSLGIGDISAVANENVFICNTKAEFITLLIELKANSNLRRKIGNNGYNFVRETYSLDSHIEKLVAIYAKILKFNK
jgi:glycosyltransferase involved in cell wall biosynthesis